MNQFLQALSPYLETPLEQTTFAQAFKGLLQFRQEVPCDWAKADDIMVWIDLERAEPQRVGGLLGMFGTTRPGAPQSLIVTVERFLDAIPNDAQDLDKYTDQRAMTFTLDLEYAPDVLGLEEFETPYFDTSEFPSTEQFVEAVLDNDLLKKVALLRPRSVKLYSDEDETV